MTPEQIAKSNTEHSHQAALFCYAQQSGIPELKWLFAVPNGFFGSPAQKAKMLAEGLKPGVWDIHLPVSGFFKGENGLIEQWFGLWIEMKHERMHNRKDGGLTAEQISFKQDLQGEYAFVVAYSWQEARDAIMRYLGRM